MDSVTEKQRSWRLVLSGHNDGCSNMAVDEALFTSYAQGQGFPTLRLYGWNPPAFSVGCFQDVHAAFDLARCSKESIPIVRRMTGGGAIFHNRELTYSIVCSQDDLNADGPVLNSYRAICGFIMNFYKHFGLDPSFAIDKNILNTQYTRRTTEFCFASQEKYDIMLSGRKIGGNAQKRRKHIIFQHGSIPLQSDVREAVNFLKETPAEIESGITALSEVLGREVAFAEAEPLLIRSFRDTFSVHIEEGQLSWHETQLCSKLIEQKYSSPEWNVDRNDGTLSQKAALA